MNRLIRTVTIFAVALISLASVYVFVVRPSAEPVIKPSNTERTVLVQIRDDSKFGVLNFVVAPGSEKWFYVPSDLLLDDVTDPVTLGSAASELVLQNPLNALNEIAGLRITDVWQIDYVAFASLVEAADGVEIAETRKTLRGFEAVAYIFEATSNSQIQLERFKEVWPQIVRSFGTRDLPNVLTSIGSSSRSTIEQTDFVGYLKMMNRNLKNFKFIRISLNDLNQLPVGARTRLIEAGVRERLAP
ncbi:MAG: hypothetical protein RLZZ330_734 [Actinomycetota bacterium]|jgi:hypothetical protein